MCNKYVSRASRKIIPVNLAKRELALRSACTPLADVSGHQVAFINARYLLHCSPKSRYSDPLITISGSLGPDGVHHTYMSADKFPYRLAKPDPTYPDKRTLNRPDHQNCRPRHIKTKRIVLDPTNTISASHLVLSYLGFPGLLKELDLHPLRVAPWIAVHRINPPTGWQVGAG